MIQRIIEDVALAMTFMTRLPIPCGWIRKERQLAEALWAMPLGGAVIGGLGSGLVLVASYMGLNAGLSGILALAVMTLATGAMHEDGLADFCDGIGGGNSPEQRLEIMRDSCLGTYGTIALILAFAALIKLIEKLFTDLEAWSFLTTIIAAAAISRCSSAIIFALLPPARNNGLAVFFGHPRRINLVLTLAWPASLTALFVGQSISIALLGGTLIATLITALIAYKYLGGYTGDVLGAGICLSFIASLISVLLTL